MNSKAKYLLVMTGFILGTIGAFLLIQHVKPREPHPADKALATIEAYTGLGVSLPEYANLLTQYSVTYSTHGDSLRGKDKDRHEEQLRLHSLAGEYWACELEIPETRELCIARPYEELKQEFAESIESLKANDPKAIEECKTAIDPEVCEASKLIPIQSMVRFLWSIAAHRNAE